MRRAYFDRVCAVCASEPTLRELIAVVGQQVPEYTHRPTVGVTAQDTQSTQCSSASRLIAREDPVSGEEEVQPERSRNKRRTQASGLYHCDRQESEAAVHIQREPGWKQWSQYAFRNRIGKDQRCPQLGFDRHSVSPEQVQQSRASADKDS